MQWQEEKREHDMKILKIHLEKNQSASTAKPGEISFLWHETKTTPPHPGKNEDKK